MKKILVIIAIMALFLSVAVSADRSGEETADVRVTLLNQEPDPAQPGQIVDIRFKVENEGGIEVDDLVVSLEDTYPFTLYPSAERDINVGSLNAYQVNDQRAVIEYTIRVDPEAVEGTKEIELTYEYRQGGTLYQFEAEYELEVRTANPDVNINSVRVTPSQIPPGEQGTISVVVQNTAPTPLYDVTLDLDMSATTTPLAPLGGSTQQRESVLLAGDTATFTFPVIASPDASPGVYKIPLDISFDDYLFNETSREDLIGVVVGDSPEVLVFVDEHDLVQGFSRGIIPITVVNRGVVDTKFMTIEVEETSDFTLTSPAQNYIGNLDSDDFETVEFSVLSSNEGGDALVVPVKVSYKDANNEQYMDDIALTVRLPNQSDIQESRGSLLPVIVVVIVVAVVIYFVWRRVRRKKKA